MRKPSLGAIFLTVFLDLLGFGIVLPFLAEEARTGFGTTALMGTLLASVYSLMQFLFVPVWGRISDRVGRRPVLLISVAGAAVGMAALGFGLAYGGSIGWLFAARAFSGIATANLGTASAYIADVTAPEDRARGMGLFGIAFGLGFIFGPAIGGFLAEQTVGGRHGPLACFVAAGLSVVNFGWVMFGLGESLPKDKRGPARKLSPLDLTAMREAFAQPGIGACVLVNFMIVVSFTNLDQTFRFFNHDMFAMSRSETGGALALIGIVAALVQGGMIRPLAKAFGERPLIISGVALQAVAFAGLAASPSMGRWALYAGGAFLAVGNGLTQPSVSAYISRRATPTRQGSTLGTNQAFAALARTIGPGVGGFLYGEFGPRSPYVVASLGMLVALALSARLSRQPESAP